MARSLVSSSTNGSAVADDPATGPGIDDRIRSAWQGRVSGCQLGKAVELLSMREGHAALRGYLDAAGVDEIRDYLPLVEGTSVARQFPQCCRGGFDRSEPDAACVTSSAERQLRPMSGFGRPVGDEAGRVRGRVPAGAATARQLD